MYVDKKYVDTAFLHQWTQNEIRKSMNELSCKNIKNSLKLYVEF